jgi:hypothetical protein
MSYQRLAYDDPSSTTQMASDCARVGQALQLAGAGHERRRAGAPADRSVGTPEVSDELAALAAGLELHLD